MNYLVLTGMLFLMNCTSKPASQSRINNEGTEVLAEGLEVPWGMDFLPDGRLLVNERPGRISVIDLKTKQLTELMKRDIRDRAEGGLLGLAIDPQFAENHYIFIYETHESGNRVVRLKFENERLSEDIVILDSIPKKMFHDGGIIRFGPDGYLYAGTGDARDPQSAQDINSTAGKILRMDRNGGVPPDNPFNNLVWSYGHRNVQGICWNEKGEMFASEHGPSGELNGWCCNDELNTIRKGENYGWPFVIGDSKRENTLGPLSHSGDDTWAPGGIAFLNGSIYMACLRGERLIMFGSEQANPSKTDLFSGQYGRLRNIIATPDGKLIFCSSNRDGRGNPANGDDKIYLLSPTN